MNHWIDYIWAFLVIMLVGIIACGREPQSDLWGSGILEAREIVISALGNGPILEMRYDEGDRVPEGEVVAVLDTVDMVLQRQGLEAQLAEVDASLRGIRLTAARAQEELELARVTAERTQALYEQGSVNKQTLDEVQTKKNVAELTLQEIRNKSQELQARRHRIENSIDQLAKKIDDAVVRAPSSGVVINRLREPGEVVRYSEPLITLADNDTMWMKIYLREDVLDQVSLGATAQVRVDAIGDDTLPGIVRWIASEAEFTPKNVETRQSRTGLVYAVKIDVPNPDGILKIGMPAEAEILESQ
jgi:HlyD family secretion protein